MGSEGVCGWQLKKSLRESPKIDQLNVRIVGSRSCRYKGASLVACDQVGALPVPNSCQ